MSVAGSPRSRSRSVVALMSETPRWVFLLLLAVFFLTPVLWLLVAPSKSDAALATAPPLSFGSFENVLAAWGNLIAYQDGAVLTWLLNSAVYTAGGLVLAIAVTIPAGYALALTRFVGRQTLLTLTLLTMLIPSAALVLPIYLQMSAASLVGTPLSVILPFAFFPFGVYLVFIYYSTSVSQELLNAARLDGCSEWQIFTQIAVPLAKPVIALVAFFNFVGNWNNYFLPFVMLANSRTYPIQIGLQELLSSTPAFNPAVGADLAIKRPELALAVILATLPVLIIFLFSQRALVSGMLAGATKG